ncbi:hypothetical protein [Candidatus Borrarchaeum sp.]|uniref:hypothetical protein n=1 Tax=Candidatus Borrarchaeum sp. TaxID=2846742 RepID=UPI0025802A4C|nr:hypothetical protein [Candidatus Borrarchaeum sp.]
MIKISDTGTKTYKVRVKKVPYPTKEGIKYSTQHEITISSDLAKAFGLKKGTDCFWEFTATGGGGLVLRKLK